MTLPILHTTFIRGKQSWEKTLAGHRFGHGSGEFRQSNVATKTRTDPLHLHIFQIGNLFHCIVDSWWNMPFKGTRHGNGVADGAVAKRLLLWQHASALWRHAVWIRIVTSHNAWMGYEYSLQNMNRPRAIHKHDPHPLETMGRVW